MSIEFLICTIDSRIEKTVDLLLPPMEGVSYLISWQRTQSYKLEVSELEKSKLSIGDSVDQVLEKLFPGRDDVRLVVTNTRGLSKNRNNALRHANGDLLVVSDDDCRYSSKSIEMIRQSFLKYKDAAAIQFQGYSLMNEPLHKYPSFSYEYRNRPKGVYVSSWELVLRRSAGLPLFDERFGIGAYLGCGEEEIFIENLSSEGKKIYYVPQKLVETDGGTTGSLFYSSFSVQRAKGGVLAIIYGPVGGLLRLLKFAFLCSKGNLLQRFGFCLQMLKGYIYVYSHHSIS